MEDNKCRTREDKGCQVHVNELLIDVPFWPSPGHHHQSALLLNSIPNFFPVHDASKLQARVAVK